MKKRFDNSIFDICHSVNDSQSLTQIDYEMLEKYYRLYEYTDDICVLEDNPLYPGLLNYVKTGLLTNEELKDALEYDKDLNH